MSQLRLTMVCSLALLAAAGGRAAVGAPPASQQRAFFENKIRPVLVKHCYECHSADAKEVGGKLLLDSREGMLLGGESGPVLVAGKPRESLLIQALRFEDIEMPPEKPLPEAVVNAFVKWIEQGAADPRTGATLPVIESTYDQDALWSFSPRQIPLVPDVRDQAWARDPLDRFVLSRIEAAGLAPAADAPSRTLVRRLYVDLLGLPPSFEQAEAFAAAHQRDGARAVKQLVDDLLARRQFGERWGRHWLDVARYAESNGDDGLGRNATFPHAWRYRDYVIAAMNDDVPYDRFLTEQIAGDLLPAQSADERNRQLIATGFLAIGSKPAAAMNKNFAMDIVDDQIGAVGTAVMGLSVACARCHDHKHDPIPTRDYGRPGLTPDDGKNETGHNHQGFTFWLAGGGVKSGHAYGRTSDTGSRAVEGKVHFRDLHATILHLVGLQHDRLSFYHEGRQHRLTGPEGGKVVEELFA